LHFKKEFSIKKIEDTQTKVSINSESHLISELKDEVKNCFATAPKLAEAPVVEMWEEKQ
jgi:hypothetical protein